jgi:WD40 repeat protein
MSEPAFSRDGRYLALSHPADGTVTVWDSSSLENLSTERLFSVRQRKLRLAFSPDGAEIAATGPEGWMVLWRWKDKDRDPTRIRAHGRVIFSLLYSADGTRLYTGGGGYLKAWDRTTNSRWQVGVSTTGVQLRSQN